MPKTVIVTGASRGIGAATAAGLAKKTCRVIATARSEKLLDKLHQKYPECIQYHTTDLTDQSQIESLTGFIKKNYKGIDIIINNAGALVNKPFEELTKADWFHMFETNVVSLVELTKAMIPLLNTDAHIVNISSMGGFQGSEKFAGLSAYSTVKGGVSILSECLAVELAKHQVKVNALCIGSVQTEMFKKAFPGFQADVSPEKMGTYIADFALNGSTFYNGQILPVALKS